MTYANSLCHAADCGWRSWIENAADLEGLKTAVEEHCDTNPGHYVTLVHNGTTEHFLTLA